MPLFKIFCDPLDYVKLQDETKAYLRTLPDAPPGLKYFVCFSHAWGMDKNANRAAGIARADGLPGNYLLHLVNEEATYHAGNKTLFYCDAVSEVKLSMKILHL